MSLINKCTQSKDLLDLRNIFFGSIIWLTENIMEIHNNRSSFHPTSPTQKKTLFQHGKNCYFRKNQHENNHRGNA